MHARRNRPVSSAATFDAPARTRQVAGAALAQQGVALHRRQAIEASLAESDPALWTRRVELARANDWRARHQLARMAVEESYPVVSIIVVSYFNAELTRLCLESIFATRTWLKLGLLVLMLGAALAGCAWLATWMVRRPGRRAGVVLTAILVGVFVVQNGIYAWVNAAAYTPVTSQTRILPGYRPLTAKRWFRRHGLMPHSHAPIHLAAGVGLDYPRDALDCAAPSRVRTRAFVGEHGRQRRGQLHAASRGRAGRPSSSASARSRAVGGGRAPLPWPRAAAGRVRRGGRPGTASR